MNDAVKAQFEKMMAWAERWEYKGLSAGYKELRIELDLFRNTSGLSPNLKYFYRATLAGLHPSNGENICILRDIGNDPMDALENLQQTIEHHFETKI